MEKIKIELTEFFAVTWKQKFLYWLFTQFAKSFCKNPKGMVAGWWQSWMIDYKCYDYVCRKHPTNKNWVTSHYQVSHHRQLCSIQDLRWAVSNPVFKFNEKKDLMAIFTLQLWQANDLITTVDMVMIEKEHNYCKLDFVPVNKN